MLNLAIIFLKIHSVGQMLSKKFLFFHLLRDLIRTRGRKSRNNADRYRVDDIPRRELRHREPGGRNAKAHGDAAELTPRPAGRQSPLRRCGS